MHDAPAKLLRLAQLIDVVAEASGALRDAHHARVYLRAAFLALHSFLDYAPYQKNRAGLATADREDVEARLRRLRGDREDVEAIRHRTAAHHQEVDLVVLFEQWAHADDATAKILRDDVLAIYRALATGGTVAPYAVPEELSSGDLHRAFSTVEPSEDGVTVAQDRVAGTRPNTIMSIPCHPDQEKAQRVVTVCEHLTVESGLSAHVAETPLARFALQQLFACDAVSLVEGIFLDVPGDADRGIPDDPSLLSRWEKGPDSDGRPYAGAAVLRSFVRDPHLETATRELRNKACAHFDVALSMAEIDALMSAYDFVALGDYVTKVVDAFQRACRTDLLTHRFANIGGIRVKGAVGTGPGASKPYR